MDIQGLKDKILQLAIQGKLVEQDKNDEPASVLLERIKEERDKLVREKKIKKEKQLPEITEEEKPFQIPEGWEWVRLGEVINFINGYAFKSRDFVSMGIGVVRIGDIVNCEIVEDKMVYISKDENINNSYHVEYGDLLIAMSGATTGKLGFNKNRKIYYLNQRVGKIEPFECDKKYIFYLLSTKIEENLNKSAGSAIPNLSTGQINSIVIPLPPLAEQKRIVEKVDELFALIDELDSNKEDLLEVINLTRNQVLQEAIQGKLVEQNPEDEPASILIQRIKEERDKLVKEKKIRKPKKLSPIEEEEKLFEIPKGWEWVRLGEVTIINPRNSLEDNKEASFVPMALIDEGFRNNHTSEVRLWKDIKRGFTHFAENDVAIAKITPCFENRKSAIMRNLVNEIGAGTTELHIIRSVNALILPEYILNICKTDRFIKEGVATYTGTAGQQRISKDYIMNLTIPLPPLAEQKRIVEKVDMIMDMLDELEKELIINI